MLAELHIYLGVALAGVISFLSPCVLPLVPPYLGYLGGTTMDQLTDEGGVDNAVWRRVVLASVCFVLGFTTIFVGLGAGASVLGKFIQTYKGEMSLAAGLIIILFGLHFLGLFKIGLFYREARYQTSATGASYLGAYVIGLAFAFGWTPCVGPILATVLTVAANEGSLGAGVKLLLAYSLGLGIPFILAAVAIRPFLAFMKRFRRHMGMMEKIMGALLVLTGILFANSYLNWLPDWMSMNFFGQWMLENIAVLSKVEEMAWVGLLMLLGPIGLALYLFAFKRWTPNLGRFAKVAGALVVLVGMYGLSTNLAKSIKIQDLQSGILKKSLQK